MIDFIILRFENMMRCHTSVDHFSVTVKDEVESQNCAIPTTKSFQKNLVGRFRSSAKYRS